MASWTTILSALFLGVMARCGLYHVCLPKSIGPLEESSADGETKKRKQRRRNRSKKKRAKIETVHSSESPSSLLPVTELDLDIPSSLSNCCVFMFEIPRRAVHAIVHSGKNIPRGYDLGYYVMGETIALYEKPVVGRRFNGYHRIALPERKHYNANNHRLVYHCLKLMTMYSELHKSKRTILYHTTFKEIKSFLPYCGELCINHLLNAIAIAGVVPIWYSEEIVCTEVTKSIEFFEKQFGFVKGKNMGGITSLYKTLVRVLPEIIDLPPSLRLAENITCKVFRAESQSNANFRNVVFEGQAIFVPQDFQVLAYGTLTDGEIFDGGILDKFAWNKTTINREDFIQRIKPFVPEMYSNEFEPPKAIQKMTCVIEFEDGQHSYLFTAPNI